MRVEKTNTGGVLATTARRQRMSQLGSVLTPSTAAGGVLEDVLFSTAGDCVLNRMFRPMRETVPLLCPLPTLQDSNRSAVYEQQPLAAAEPAAASSESTLYLDSDSSSAVDLRANGSKTLEHTPLSQSTGYSSSLTTNGPSRSVGALCPGAKFIGRQHAADEGKTYPVDVEIKDVNVAQNYLCGYLSIENLTQGCPRLTTFFEAEIVGPQFGFLTDKWDADLSADRRHWQRFPYFSAHCQHFLAREAEAGAGGPGMVSALVSRPPTTTSSPLYPFRSPLAHTPSAAAATPNVFSTATPSRSLSSGAGGNSRLGAGLNYSSLGAAGAGCGASATNAGPASAGAAASGPSGGASPLSYRYTDHGMIFMRWKEQFLVPDHHIETVNGASYAGFYYMAYDLKMETLEGFYYHRSSNDYQRICLSHKPSHSFSHFEFR